MLLPSQLNPLHILAPYFTKFHFNVPFLSAFHTFQLVLERLFVIEHVQRYTRVYPKVSGLSR
jgi:hypothetical protein